MPATLTGAWPGLLPHPDLETFRTPEHLLASIANSRSIKNESKTKLFARALRTVRVTREHVFGLSLEWPDGVSTRTDWPSVSLLWVGQITCLSSNFCFSDVTRTPVLARFIHGIYFAFAKTGRLGCGGWGCRGGGGGVFECCGSSTQS